MALGAAQFRTARKSAVYGYYGGGSTALSAVQVATCDRITFSTGASAASTISNISNPIAGQMGMSDTAIYGYSMGGATWSGAGYVVIATTDRITFSTSVTATNTVSNSTIGRFWFTALSDGSVYGYALGGVSTVATAVADRTTFTTGTTAANTASNLSTVLCYTAGTSDGSLYGYICGGYSGSGLYLATTQQMTFSTGGVAANTASNLSGGRALMSALSDNAVYGYVSGGYNTSYAFVAITDRITFSTSVTAANTASNLSGTRYTPTGVSDGTLYGYMMGGYTGAAISTTDRIVFSTSITAANTISNLSTARWGGSGISDGAV